MTSDPPNPHDHWSRWLLETRHGGDPDFLRRVHADTHRFRDRVLAGAALAPAMTLVDIGSGEGLIPFAAIERFGPSLRAIFTDISAPLLKFAEQSAISRGVESQCRFLHASAENLSEIPPAHADSVTSRAAIAYVPDKPAAFRECFRILKPAGRLSIAEPILRDEALEACALTQTLQSQPAHADTTFLRLLQLWKAAQFPSTAEAIAATPLVNFSERDLVRFAKGAGFSDLHMELHIDLATAHSPIGPAVPATWETFLAVSPHPAAPPRNKILAEHFSPDERALFERLLRPAIESKTWRSSSTVAYLTACKPAQ